MVGVICVMLKYKIDVNMCEYFVVCMFVLNEIGVCNLSFDWFVVFDLYDWNCYMGGFIVIDCFSNDMVGVGMLYFVLCCVYNVYW